MPLVYADRVLEVTETEGLGTYALDGTLPGWQAFDAIGSGNQCYYCAFASDDFGAPIGAWEVGKGTFGARALTRDQILASSAGGAAIDWQPGTRRVMNVHPAAALGAQALPAHASTHQPGGSDPMQVDAPAATGSLRTLGSGAQQAAPGNDPRLSDARPPQAHASTHAAGGGDVVDVKTLGGYPGGTTNFLRADRTFAAPPAGGGGTPSPHAATHEPGGSDPLAVDAAPAVGSLRTLGSGAQQAAPGNDARLTGPRPPTAHASTHQPGGSDPMQVDAPAATGSLRTLGPGAQQAAPGNDARLSDARPPQAHAGTHSVNGSDPVNVTLLGGFAGDGSYCLRGDRTFAPLNDPKLARRDASNTFTTGQPSLRLVDTGGTVDARAFEMLIAGGNSFYLRPCNDAGTGGFGPAMIMSRNGDVNFGSAVGSPGGYYERNRGTRMGDWQDAPYNAGWWSADASSISVNSFWSHGYMLIGQTLFYTVHCNATLSAPSQIIRIIMPNGWSTLRQTSGAFNFSSQFGWEAGLCYANSGANTVILMRAIPQQGVNGQIGTFAAGTLLIYFTIAVPVNA